MSFQTRYLVGFGVAVLVAAAGTMVLPQPYPDGVDIEPTTGGPIAVPWRRLADLRQSGDLGLVAAGIRQLAEEHPADDVVRGLQAMIARELAPPEVAADPVETAPVEAYFAGVGAGDALDALDAVAAELQQELAAGRRAPANRLLAIAERYRRAGRANAEWRWLARAFAQDPGSLRAADGLLALYVASGALDRATTLVEQHTADRSRDLGWQRQLAQLGAWTSRPALETRALERIVALVGDPLDRARLIELYSFLGTPERALVHAVAIADGASETAAAEQAAKSALSAGFVDEGLGMLRRAAARAPLASPWLKRFAELALQDLRLPEVEQALEQAARLDPEAVEESLEDLYRRTDRPVELADLLQGRLAANPSDQRLWNEVITLRSALGQREAARLLAAQRDAVLADPDHRVAALPAELRGRASAVRQQALALALATGSDGGVVGDTLEQLRPFFAQPEFRGLAEMLLARHPDDPRAKPMRLELLDYDRTPLAAEQAAAALSATYPDDLELLAVWLQRAQWAELVPAQLQARQRIAALAPDDLDNRYELADLLEWSGAGEAALPHWRFLVAAEGVRSRAVARLIDGLFAMGAENDAIEWLQRLAADPAATTAQRLQAADELFFRRSYDRARVLYAAVLEVEPESPRALLRLGQIAAWTNDPRSAVGFFERRLAVSDEDGALVRFYLGEALWILGKDGSARALHREALAAYQALPAPDITARSCMATMLARLGEREAAITAYRDLVARSPRDVDIVLDYADVVLASGDVATARALAVHAEALAPEQARVLRFKAAVAASAGDHVTADRAFGDILTKFGSDAAVLGDQTQLRLDAGNWSGARASAMRWLELKPDSIAARRTDFEIRQVLADAGVGGVRHRSVGRDRMTSIGGGGVLMLSDRHWLQGRVAAVTQRGATSLGSGEATADYTRLDAAFGMRSGRTDRMVLGITAAPGANGETPVGLFAAGHFEWPESGLSVGLRARWHELMAEPMAAAGLGGRHSGVDVTAYQDLGAGFWSSLHGGLDQLELDPDIGPRLSDLRWRGDVSVGYRLIDGDVAVAAAFDPASATVGTDSPFLLASPAETRPWLCNAWLGWQSAHLLGDAALAGVLPLVRDDDFAIAALRVDRHVADTLGLSVTGYTGLDARRGGSVYGVGAALTWRPAFGAEFLLAGSQGEALGRSDGGRDQQLQLQMVLRW